MPPWNPILEGQLAASARAVVETIATRLAVESSDDVSLAGGAAGHAVLFAHLARASPQHREYAELRDRFLDKAIDAVAMRAMPHGFLTGFTGIAWTMEHLAWLLSQDRGVTDTHSDPCEGIDEMLIDFIRDPPQRQDYDLVSGLVGVGVYALERVPRRTSVALVTGIIDLLAQTAIEDAAGVSWWTDASLLPTHQRAVFPDGYWNLGLAHGVPGVVGFLGRACGAGAAGESGRKLLEGAVAWLLAQRLPDGLASRFPSMISPGDGGEPSRAAWCYGDPGVAASLFVAARGAGVARWERAALVVARESAQKPPETAGVVDAGLCHGAAGLAHLYHRFHVLTGDPTLANAARAWFVRTLEMRGADGEGFAGFRAFAGEDGWTAESGLLNGGTGIALALLAAVDPHPPTWGRILLLE